VARDNLLTITEIDFSPNAQGVPARVELLDCGLGRWREVWVTVPLDDRLQQLAVRVVGEAARAASTQQAIPVVVWKEGYAAIAASNGNTDLSSSGVMTSTPHAKLSASSGIEPGITM
jgi:hypothetical protein